MRHKYKVGQMVDFAPNRSFMQSGASQYQIVSLLPADSGQPQYRIKSKAENFERMVKEFELSRR